MTANVTDDSDLLIMNPTPKPAEEALLQPPPPKAEAWAIDFGPCSSKGKGKGSKRERAAKVESKLRRASGASESLGEEPLGEGGENTGATRALTVVDGESFLDLAIAIPRNLPTTRADMEARNFVDHQQLLCMVRQYKAGCGVSSLTSVWNRLYSVIGSGSLPPVSQEEVMNILGFEPPFDQIRWGPFTGNATLIRWFHRLNEHFGVKGKAYYLYKAHGYGRTMGIQNVEEGKEKLFEAIRNPNCGVIYHCHNHYMVPLGFISSPKSQLDVYAPSVTDVEPFIMIGEVSRGKHPPMHIKRWADMATDLNCASPNFFNIRHTELGVQIKDKCKTAGRNIHCLLAFRSDVVEENLEAFLRSDAEGEGEEEDGVEIAAEVE